MRNINKYSRIYLIGFMGAGKTFLGKQLARELNLAFYDLDDEIESQTGLSIPDIFEKYGEVYFRGKETDLLHSWDKPGVIATGGGIVEQMENRKLLSQALTVWLHPGWEVIVNRIINSDRPLVKQLGKDGLYNLWQKRELYYRQSAKIVYTGNEVKELSDLILVQ